MSTTRHLLFVSCALGLEALLQRELAELGCVSELKEGGVELRAGTTELFRLAVGSAVAEGVRVRLKSFIARDFGALEEGVKRLPWRAYLRAGEAVRVRVVSHRSKLWHSGAVEERVARALVERVGVRLDAEDDEGDEATTIFVRLTGDAVQISVDATGRLHRRGYRTHVEKASLRETLAAALVRVAQEARPGERPAAIWDPFCGAGTVALEAARHFSGIAPGSGRTFAFERWPTHDAELWEKVRAGARHDDLTRAAGADAADGAAEDERTAARGATENAGGARLASGPLVRVFASDISERALEATRHNAERAGVASLVELIHGDFEAVAPDVPRGAWVVTNPPYGERLANGGLAARLSRLLDKRRDLRPAVVLVGGSAKKELSGRFRVALQTKNGGLAVQVRVLDP